MSLDERIVLRVLSITLALMGLMQMPAEARGRSGGGGCCVMVRGYVRSNGTYIQPYFRSSPNHRLVARSPSTSAFTGTGGLSAIGTPTAFGTIQYGPFPVTAPEFEAPVEVAYKPVFKGNDRCKGHKLYGEKTGAAVCIIGGQDEAD